LFQHLHGFPPRPPLTGISGRQRADFTGVNVAIAVDTLYTTVRLLRASSPKTLFPVEYSEWHRSCFGDRKKETCLVSAIVARVISHNAPALFGLVVCLPAHAADASESIRLNAAVILALLGVWSLVMGLRNLRDLRYRPLTCTPSADKRERPKTHDGRGSHANR
jgi:hypothetical protein